MYISHLLYQNCKVKEMREEVFREKIVKIVSWEKQSYKKVIHLILFIFTNQPRNVEDGNSVNDLGSIEQQPSRSNKLKFALIHKSLITVIKHKSVSEYSINLILESQIVKNMMRLIWPVKNYQEYKYII